MTISAIMENKLSDLKTVKKNFIYEICYKSHQCFLFQIEILSPDGLAPTDLAANAPRNGGYPSEKEDLDKSCYHMQTGVYLSLIL